MKKIQLQVISAFMLLFLAAVNPSYCQVEDDDRYWDPYEEMQLLQERMERLREQSLGGLGQFSSAYPDMDVEETAEVYIVKAHVPGFEKEQIDIEVHGNTVKISGKQQLEEKKEKEGEAGRRFYMKQTRFGAFSRSINLPGKFDENAVQAEYKNGVLTVTLPKLEKEPPVKAKKIKVI